MPHPPHHSRLHLEDARHKAGTWLSVVDFATFIHVLYTHQVTGSSQEEEVTSDCGPRRLELVPLELCPLPTLFLLPQGSLSHTEQKVAA